VPTTANGRVVPTATTEDVRPREMGRYRRVMSSGDKQDQNANGDWHSDLKRGQWAFWRNHDGSTKKGPFNTGLFFACTKATLQRHGRERLTAKRFTNVF
jgi:hypothetical protein